MDSRRRCICAVRELLSGPWWQAASRIAAPAGVNGVSTQATQRGKSVSSLEPSRQNGTSSAMARRATGYRKQFRSRRDITVAVESSPSAVTLRPWGMTNSHYALFPQWARGNILIYCSLDAQERLMCSLFKGTILPLS